MRTLFVMAATLCLVASANAGGPVMGFPSCCQLLGEQTQINDCSLGFVADTACSPGDILEEAYVTSCGHSLPQGYTDFRIPLANKRSIGVAYGLPATENYGPQYKYDVVPVVPWVLGGASHWNLAANFPIPTKLLVARTRLIQYLAEIVYCAPHSLTQQQAQHAMLDWVGTYTLVFGKQPTSASLRAATYPN